MLFGVGCSVITSSAAGCHCCQVMGGECNYLHRIAIKKGRIGLEVVPPDLWKDGRGVRWSSEAITELLDTAEVRCHLVLWCLQFLFSFCSVFFFFFGRSLCVFTPRTQPGHPP